MLILFRWPKPWHDRNLLRFEPGPLAIYTRQQVIQCHYSGRYIIVFIVQIYGNGEEGTQSPLNANRVS